MARNVLPLLVALLTLVSFSLESSPSACAVSSDCDEDKKCCGQVCLKRNTCDGLCRHDNECDNVYGELCVDQQCICASSPCLGDTTTQVLCYYDSQCSRNETCQNRVCQPETRYHTQPMNTTVLIVVATVGLIVFAGAFYLCLRQQKSARPSIAAKELHQQALVRARANNASFNSDISPSIKSDFNIDEERGNGKRHLEHKQKKPPLSSPVSMVELSAIIEEDEISEAISK